jgi:hypothetical protein
MYYIWKINFVMKKFNINYIQKVIYFFTLKMTYLKNSKKVTNNQKQNIYEWIENYSWVFDSTSLLLLIVSSSSSIISSLSGDIWEILDFSFGGNWSFSSLK